MGFVQRIGIKYPVVFCQGKCSIAGFWHDIGIAVGFYQGIDSSVGFCEGICSTLGLCKGIVRTVGLCQGICSAVVLCPRYRQYCRILLRYMYM